MAGEVGVKSRGNEEFPSEAITLRLTDSTIRLAKIIFFIKC